MKTVKKEPEDVTPPVPMTTDVVHRDPRMRDPRLTGRDPRMASAQVIVDICVVDVSLCIIIVIMNG